MCVYRTPSSFIDVFNEKDNEFVNLKTAKDQIVKHSKTIDFIKIMYSNMLFSIISKPRRITIDTTTLIDNIFSNKIEGEIVGDLMMSEISNHLPVFALFQPVQNW